MMQKDPLEQAFQLYQNGRYDAAAQVYRALLAYEPANTEANHMMGVMAFQQGQNKTARDFISRAVAGRGPSPEMHNNLGSVLMALGEQEPAAVAFNKALALKPDYADALNNLGVVHRNAKRIEQAIECFRKAVTINPDHSHAKGNLRAAYRDVVPGWHFAMMDDHQRNDTYEAAIRRAVPGKRVLDIGTGAGLLTLLAARSGAASVTSCETVGVIAERARMIVERNGYANTVKVIAKRSQDLVIGRDMPERAQVLITETFSSGLINEEVLPTVEHAHEHLLTPDAVVIPAVASAMGYLAGGEALKGFLYCDRVKDFDMAPFDDFAPPNMGLLMDRFPHQSLSDDVELMRFNLKDKTFPMDSRRVVMQATQSGLCYGVVQWIRLDLDEFTRYENRPATDAPFCGHWTHLVYRLPKPLQLKAGDSVPLIVRHYRTQITVELESAGAPA